MRDAWVIFIHEDTVRRALEIVVLAATDAPKKGPEHHQQEDEADWNEDVENAHVRRFDSILFSGVLDSPWMGL